MPKIVDHQEKREGILEGCFSLFAERGFGSITMREIAQTLGVSTGTLYHYFPKKEALFEEMLAWMSRREIVKARAEIQESQGVEARLEILFRHLSTQEGELQKLLLMALDFLRGTPGGSTEPIRKTVAMYREVLASDLGLEGTPFASLLFSFLTGMLIHRLLDPTSAEIAQHREFLLSLGKLVVEDQRRRSEEAGKEDRKKSLQKPES